MSIWVELSQYDTSAWRLYKTHRWRWQVSNARVSRRLTGRLHLIHILDSSHSTDTSTNYKRTQSRKSRVKKKIRKQHPRSQRRVFPGERLLVTKNFRIWGRKTEKKSLGLGAGAVAHQPHCQTFLNHINSMKQLSLFVPYRWGNWDTEK